MKPVYFIDFDHTISNEDVWDAIVKMSDPDEWKALIGRYLNGELTSRTCNAQLSKIVRGSETEARELVLSIGIDPSFHDFVRWVRERGFDMMIVSDGYDYYIQMLLEQEGLLDIPYYCNQMVWENGGVKVEFPLTVDGCENDMAHCKCQHLEKHVENRRVYIGDGMSDICAARKCEKVYAKRNLLEYCEQNGIAYTPFQSFLDIIKGEEAYLDETIECAV